MDLGKFTSSFHDSKAIRGLADAARNIMKIAIFRVSCSYDVKDEGLSLFLNINSASFFQKKSK